MKKIIFLFISLGLISPRPTHAQDSSGVEPKAFETMTLQDLLMQKVVTASKSDQTMDKAPATVIVITKEQIKMRGYQSLLDVMYDLPDVKIDDKIYSGARSNMVVRGTSGQEKFIILLDGNRISSPIDEALPIMENYPVNLAERVEIVYGPASALYGANAVSGVINIISRKSTSKKTTLVDASSSAGTDGYTNNTFFLANKLSDRVSIMISGQYYYDKQPDLSKVYKNDSAASVASYSTGTLNTIYGPVTPSKSITPAYEAPMDAYNIYAALHVDDFSLSYFRNYTNTPSAYGSNASNAVYNKDAFLAQGLDMINATYKKSVNKFTSTSSLSGCIYNLYPQSNYRNLYTGGEPAYKYETSTSIKTEQQLDYKASEKLNFTGGAVHETFSVVPYSADLDGPVNPAEDIHQSYLGTKSYYRPEGLPAKFYFLKYHNTGTFLQAQYSPASRISFTIGARYEWNSRYGSTFNPRLGLVYKPYNRTIIKLLYGSAFLAPSPSDEYGYWGSFVTADSGRTYHSYFMHLPNPNLKPITSRNAEVSVQQFLSDNLSFTLDGYYTEISNLHVFADDSKTTNLYHNMFNGIPVDYVEVFINQSRQTNYGGSIQLNLKNSIGRVKMSSYAALSYVNGVSNIAPVEKEETSPDVELEYISHIMIHAGSDVKIGKFSIAPRVIFMTHQHITGTQDTINNIVERQSIPGYTLLNIALRYTVMKHFSVFANITNALNQKYRSVGYGMDLNNPNNGLFRGQPEDPIRIVGGFNLIF